MTQFENHREYACHIVVTHLGFHSVSNLLTLYRDHFNCGSEQRYWMEPIDLAANQF